MSNIDTERLESFHLVPVSTQQVGSNVGKKTPKQQGKERQKQMWLKSHDFQLSDGKCLRCTSSFRARHERNPTGRGTAGYCGQLRDTAAPRCL